MVCALLSVWLEQLILPVIDGPIFIGEDESNAGRKTCARVCVCVCEQTGCDRAWRDSYSMYSMPVQMRCGFGFLKIRRDSCTRVSADVRESRIQRTTTLATCRRCRES